MGKQDMALRGGMEGRLAAEATSRPRPESQSLLRRKASPCWACSSSLATCAAQGDLPTPAWGKRKGQSPEGGVDWYLDKVREKAELKEEDLQA